MPRLPLLLAAAAVALLPLAACSSPGLAEAEPAAATPPAAAPPPAAASASEPAAPTPTWPGITLGRDAETGARHVDVAATVVTREGEWMELLACTEGTLEYESVLALKAQPSHIHLALIAIGLEPGRPLGYEDTGDGYRIIPPAGPRVAVTIVLPDGQEVPANEWIQDQTTGQPMPDNLWLFTGSNFVEHEGRNVYVADVNGTAITLVSFGDDLLGKATQVTNQTDNKAWNVRTDRVPPVNTPVTLRLRPARPAADATQPPATQPATATQPAE